MLTMQDPADGGVYHKCTNAAFDGMVMPGLTKAPRYVVQKGTAATLDFAAVMAQAARIFRNFPLPLPGLADSCLKAATHAWSWAMDHASLPYDQEAMNKLFDPKVTTGAYGDRDFKDEWFWAAVELMVTTSSAAAAYEKIIRERMDDPAGLPSWASVHMLGNYTLLRFRNRLPAEWASLIQATAQHLVQMADSYLARVPANAFHTVMGGSPRDFVWGSNAVAANQGILLIYAWLLTKDKRYIDQAVGNLDYLLGRNATGYCFLTGMGSYSPLHPHHRPSVADGIPLPVPGLLAGGANPGRQDHQHYEFTEPETAYLDQDKAYAANEIAINWNAPMVYLAGALEALQYRAGYTTPSL
jgi:endoglucanase